MGGYAFVETLKLQCAFMGFIKKIFSFRILPSWAILLFDVVILTASVLVAFLLRYSLPEVASMQGVVISTIVLTVVLNMICFSLFRTYQNVLRLSSFIDVIHIFIALTIGFLLCILVSLMWKVFSGTDHAPVSVLMIAYVVSFLLMATSRMTIKSVNDYFNQQNPAALNTYVYGTKISGVNLAKSLRMQSQNRFRLKGFIADDPDMKGKVMMGVNVYMNDGNLVDHLREDNVAAVIVSPQKAENLKSSELADMLIHQHVKIYLAPEVTDNWKGDNPVSMIKEIQIEDLLSRSPIHVNVKEIASHLEGKRVMITGAAGSIGSEIMRQVASFNPYQLILVDDAETPLHDIRLEMKNSWSEIDAPTILASVNNLPRMKWIFERYRPDYVFHAAAYKHVPMMEDNVSEAIQNNVLGTKIVADLSLEYGVQKFVMVSTDKAVNPSNVMGCSKRICEIYVQSLAKKLQKENRPGTQFITTRFGNVLGSNGSVIPLFRKQIDAGGPVTVTHPDIIRYFMTIPEACQLVLEAGSMGQGGEIYLFDMGKPVKIDDLAKKMIALSGRTDVKIEYTGLRHGEKLYEELLNVKENTKPTSHDKIMIANVREYDFDEVSSQIVDLIESSYVFDPMMIVAKMKDIVPEYKSLNSRYVVLDQQTGA